MNLQRYSRITETQTPREIALLKAFPCKWGKCSFCDYIHDNSDDEAEILKVNQAVLRQITGEYGVLQVINSGSCFELPGSTMELLRQVVMNKAINRLFFEAHWLYRHRLNEIRNFFAIPITFITGIETFDANFRNKILQKGIEFADVDEVKKYFQSVCLMIGIQGQTRDMIRQDIDILLNNFSHGTVNLFIDNTTHIKADKELQDWFKQEFAWLAAERQIDILFANTDFGVGGKI